MSISLPSRRPVVFALALAFAALAGTAGAQAHRPDFDRDYVCEYSAPWSNERNPGTSTFKNEQYLEGRKIIYGIEVYQTPTGQDNRKIAFAKWEDRCPLPDPFCDDPGSVPNRTIYEFTIKDGVQCTHTVVREGGRRIDFNGCSNGKTRKCTW